MSKTTKIRWVIAHEPLSLFVRAAQDFEKEINAQQTAEKIEIEVMTLGEYSAKYNDGILVTKHDLLDLMEQGKIEMSQMYTTWLAEHYEQDFLAFEMPYIFSDHEHASRVLEGEVGETLLAKLTDNSNVRGLAYTYSGGFRCLGVNKPVSTLADLTGEKLRSNRNPVGQAVIRTISGVEPFICETEEAREHVANGNCNGNDTVYSRIYPLSQNDVIQSVVDSKHSLFLTTMIIGDRFWDSLSAEVKAVIKAAAIQAGRNERQTTIVDGEQARDRLISEGKTVYEPTAQETTDMKDKMSVVYDQFADFFTPGLINKIKKS